MKKIAIVGLSCRFPASNNKDIFWQNLKNSLNLISEVPNTRWDIDKFYSSNPEEKGKMNTRKAGFIDDIELFDASFFNISEQEAESLDPQQRLLMEVSYEALQDAGMLSEKIKNQKGGVFIGISSNDYAFVNTRAPEQVDMYSISGAANSVASNRLSYFFDLKGPSISVDTACSSSLVSVHLACNSIESGESDFAIAGGVNVILNPLITVGFSQAQGTSPTGSCNAFSADANGMVRGEGAGVVILKTLEKALEDNDFIYAVIDGSAVNQDGRTNGLLAPSSEGQKKVLEQAYQKANITPEKVSYIETHGTGTVLGDPIEANALGNVLGKNREESNPCLIGSVKTNIGHLEAAAGIAGLIKTTLSLSKNNFLPSLNYSKPNPYIPFDNLKLKVNTENFIPTQKEVHAGVSSFGFGGTNAHIVLSNYQRKTEESKKLTENILLLSAQSEKGLMETVKTYHDFLIKNPDLNLTNLCYTANLRRDLHPFLTSLSFKNYADLLALLADFSEEQIISKPRKKKKIAFVFSGMGSQQPNMGNSLIKNEIFKAFVVKCDELMKKHHNWSLLKEFETEKTDQDIEKAQPILFVLQCGISELYKNYGLIPNAVLGSSVGEVACAYISGSLSLEDAIDVICIRNKAMCSMIGTGCMALIKKDESYVKTLLTDYSNVYISATNSHDTSIISGTLADLEKIGSTLREKEIFFRLIKGAEAPSHSPLMEPVKNFIVDNLAHIKPTKNQIPFFSTVTSKSIEGENITNTYWWDNVRQPISFYQTIEEMEAKSDYLYLEISPHPVLLAFIEETLSKLGKKTYYFESQKRDKDEQLKLLETLGKLKGLGYNLEFEKLYDNSVKLIHLPEYVWQKEFFWLNNNSENKVFSLVTQPKRKITVKETKDFTIDEIRLLSNSDKETYISDYLANNVAKVLKVAKTEIDKNNPLKNLGIGSLMGMELFNKIKNNFKISIPLSKILRGPSINEITQEIILVLNNETKEEVLTTSKKSSLIPLSFPQQRLWFIEQMESDLVAYNIPSALKFIGKLDYDILEKSVNEVIKRHESLRTNIKKVNNMPYQNILPNLELKLKIVDISEKTNSEEELNEFLKNEASIKFDLESSSLIRVTVFKLSENENIVLFTIHHIIADGFSLKILFSEITNFYSKHLNLSNEINNLPELEYQYSDFTIKQQNDFNNGFFNKQIDYWKNQLDDIDGYLTLPFDKPRKNFQSFNGAMDNFFLSEELLEKLKKIGIKKGVTVYSILLSAYKILLYKYTNHEDIIVGTPITGRNDEKWENLSGLFLNMLALRSKVNSNLTIGDFINEVSNTTLEAYDNQDLPFEKIVEIVNPERNTSHTPIFQTIMALHASVDIDDIGDIKVKYLDVDMKTAKFDLVLSFIPFGNNLKGAFEYNTDLFFAKSIEKIKNTYFKILNTITENLDLKISELEIIEKEEKTKLLDFSHGNKSFIQENISIIEKFKGIVSENKNHLAIKEEGKEITYQELENEVTKVSSFLNNINIEKALVGVFFDRSVEYIEAILGILDSGNFYLPLDPKHPKERNELILKEASPEILITSKKYQNLLPNGVKAVFIEDLKEPVFYDKPRTHCKNAYVIYTSGSTGSPKGVEISQKNLFNLISWHKANYHVSNKTNSTLIAGVSFDASVWEIFPYLLSGSTIHIPSQKTLDNIDNFITWLETEKIDITFLSTPFFEIIDEAKLEKLTTLKYLLIGGDKLSKKLDISKFNFEIHNNYGPTENTVVSTSGKITLNDEISIGKPINNTLALVLDKDLNLCPVGISGELYLGGSSLSSGYYQNQKLSNELFIKTPFSTELLYKTGDLVKWNEKGELIFIGRKDHQVKIRGIRIELAEVEKILSECKEIKQFALTVVEISGIKTLVAYLISESKELQNYLSNKLPSAFLPKLVYVSDIPLTPNGKIDFKLLEKMYLQKTTEINEKHNYTQKELLKIFQELLKIEHISIEANFFELGGHSLLAIQAIEKINSNFKIELAIKDIFYTQNLKNLAEIIAKYQKEEARSLPTIVPDKTNISEPFPLTEIQQAYLVGRESIEMGNISAHAYIEIDIENLDPLKLETAFNKVIKRHGMLRAIIENGKQKILTDIPYFQIKVIDLKTSENLDLELKAIRDSLSHEVLDYSKFPIFNVQISLINEKTSRLHYSFDAITTDASSILIVAKEINELYNNPDKNLPELYFSFRDYILAQEELKTSYFYQKAKDYWLNRINTLPEAPKLYTNSNYKNDSKPNFIRLESKLAKEQWSLIKQKASKANITTTTILITAFAKVLALWSKNKTFTLNLTLFNRLALHTEVNNILGDFTSLNLLEIDLKNRTNFELEAQAIQKQLIEDIDNRYFGGVSVLRELAKAKGFDSARMPVVFTSMLGDNSFDMSKFLGKMVYSITQTPQVWLDHQTSELDGNLIFNWDYPEGLFPDSMIKDMFASYEKLLTQLCFEDWSHFDLLPEYNKNHLESVNDTETKFPDKLLHEMFFEQANQNPEKIAVITEEESFTYQQIQTMAKNLSKDLILAGVEKNELIGILLPKGWEQIVAVLGILYAGCAYVPLNTEYPEERNTYISDLCEFKKIITNDKSSFLANLNKISINTNYSNEYAEFENLRPNISTQDTAYIIFTSGSTGLPKGVVISHEGAVNTILDINNRFKITQSDTVLALSALNFDLSVYDIFGLLAVGGTLVIPNEKSLRDPAVWSNLIEKHHITLWNSVPALMSMFVEYCNNLKDRWSNNLKTILLSGDWIPVDLPEKIWNLNSTTNIISLGGATEASIWSIFYPIDKNTKQTISSIPYGKPLANQKFYVLNESLELCPYLVEGDLYIAGKGLAKEYFKDQEKTTSAFITHPITQERLYKTGDLGRYLSDGNIEFLGRADFQVKINGYRIELGEIEKWLLEYKGVEKTLVDAVGEKNNKKLVAYLQTKEAILETDLIKHLAEKLPEYMIPKTFVFLENLPLTENGKVDRKALQNLTINHKEVKRTTQSPIANKIAKIIKETLKLEQLDYETDLLSLGANSIDIVRIANNLEEQLGFCPKIGDLFRLKNVNLIADFYEQRKTEIKEKFEFKEGKLILDPKERESFKKERFNLKKISGETYELDSEDFTNEFQEFKTTRVFSKETISKKIFGRFLSVLKEIEHNNTFKLLYPSAGSSYPVQIYVHLKEEAIEGFSKGVYYYHPQKNSLIKVTEQEPENLHFLTSNDIYKTAGFSIFMIADLKAIEPLYGNTATEYAYIEAGCITQLLRMHGAKYNMGMCSIGQINNENLSKLLNLDKKQLILHTILGGLISNNDDLLIIESDEEEWEEFLI